MSAPVSDTERVCLRVSSLSLPPIVVDHCSERMRKAKPQYGELVLATDNRDFLYEAYEEILDAINYVAMCELQGRSVPLVRVALGTLAWAFRTAMGLRR